MKCISPAIGMFTLQISVEMHNRNMNLLFFFSSSSSTLLYAFFSRFHFISFCQPLNFALLLFAVFAHFLLFSCHVLEHYYILLPRIFLYISCIKSVIVDIYFYYIFLHSTETPFRYRLVCAWVWFVWRWFQWRFNLMLLWNKVICVRWLMMNWFWNVAFKCMPFVEREREKKALAWHDIDSQLYDCHIHIFRLSKQCSVHWWKCHISYCVYL